jgi:hypothetical protein
MPDVANTSIKVCSRASVLMGGNEIQSFTDGTAESAVVDAMYEDTATAALTSMRWGFATTQSTLARLASVPDGRWDAAYQIPSTSLMVHAITVNEYPIKYDIYADMAYCDAVATDTLICDHTFRASEADWPPFFTIAVEYMMAGILAVSVARDSQLAQMMDERAQFHMMRARRLDSQQQTTKKLNTSRFIAERRS